MSLHFPPTTTTTPPVPPTNLKPAPQIAPPMIAPPQPRPMIACGIRAVQMFSCKYCDQRISEYAMSLHDQMHVTSIVESYNQRLHVEVVPGALSYVFIAGICDIIAGYAEVTAETCRSYAPSLFELILPPSALPGFKELGKTATGADTKLELERTRYEDHKICLKVSDGELLTGMRLITRFGRFLETHAEFGTESYLKKCLPLYVKFLTLQNKLDTAASEAGVEAVQLVPNYAVEVWWTAHLIRPAQYAKFCTRKFGRIVDRRSVVATNPFTADAKRSAELWTAEYHEPYTVPKANAADVKEVSNSELKAYEEDGLVHVSAILHDREWLPNFRKYAKMKEPGGAATGITGSAEDDHKLNATLHQCPKKHPLTLYKSGVIPSVGGYTPDGSFNCDGCTRKDVALTHFYHCDTCTNYDLCKNCVRKTLGQKLKCPLNQAHELVDGIEGNKRSTQKDAHYFKCNNYSCNASHQSWESDWMSCKSCANARLCELCVNAHEYASKCLLNYKRFWFFCWRFPQSAQHFAPPYPIDWVWHSAMLFPSKYHADCQTIAGTLLDHTPWPNMTPAQEKEREEYVKKMWVETFEHNIM